MAESSLSRPQPFRFARVWTCLLPVLISHHVILRAAANEWTERLDHGSVKGFPSHTEANFLLTEWVAKYPTLLKKQQIGTSYEKRPINAFVLVHPSAPAGKARVLITSLMHAREPAGLTVLLYFLGHLLELYDASDPEAVYIVRTREIWFVPFVNPDGYIANEEPKTKMIRKNRRPTCERLADSGVDINRNFGYHWRAEFAKCNEEYQGTAAFSEPETQALKKLTEDNSFKAAVNYHSFGGMLTHPFNFGNQPLPEDDAKIYHEISNVFQWEKFGTALETVGYTAPGESDDWFYGVQHIISMSPEVGPEAGDFWPSASLVGGIDSRNFERTKAVVLKAGLELAASWRQVGIANADLFSSLAQPPLALLELTLGNSGLSESAGELVVAVAGAARPGAPTAGNASAVVALNAGNEHQDVRLVAAVEAAAAPVVVLRVPPVPRRSSHKFRLAVAGGLETEGPRELNVCIREAGMEVSGGATICFCSTASLPEVGEGGASAEVTPGSFVAASSSTGAGHFARLCAAAAAGQTGAQVGGDPASMSTDVTGLSAAAKLPLRSRASGGVVVFSFFSIAAVMVLCLFAQALRKRDRPRSGAPELQRLPTLQVPTELDEEEGLEQYVELGEKARLAHSA